MDVSALPIDIFGDSTGFIKSFLMSIDRQQKIKPKDINPFFYQGQFFYCPFYNINKTDTRTYLFVEYMHINYGEADGTEKNYVFWLPSGFTSQSMWVRRPVASFDVGGTDLHDCNGFYKYLVCRDIRVSGWTPDDTGEDFVLIKGWIASL